MIEILFKAKRLDNGEWIEGYYMRHENRMLAPMGDTLKDEDVDHIILFSGFADWNMPRDIKYAKVDPSTVCEYTNIDIRREAWPSSEVHKIFTGDMLGEWGEDEDGNECVCILGVVTYWESEGCYVLADENGLCNDWTLEDEAKPENWPNLIHCGSIHDGEGGQHEEV